MTNKEDFEQDINKFKNEILQLCENYDDKLSFAAIFYALSRIRALCMIEMLKSYPEKELEIYELSSKSFEDGERDYEEHCKRMEENAN